MSAREYHHLTKEQKQDVRAAFAKLPSSMTYTEKIKEAFAAAKVVVRKPGENGKYYPSFFPWLKSSVGRGVPTAPSPRKVRTAETAVPTKELAPAERLNAAVRSLGRALVDFVLAEVTASLQQSALSLQPAKIAAAAAPADRRPLTAESSLHSLSDQQLRDRLGVAKAAKNLSLAAKITNVLRMRDRSATVIANSAEVES